MDKLAQGIAGIVAALMAVAVLAVVLSNSANTTGVMQAFFSGVTGLLQAAVNPVVSASGTSGASSQATLPGGAWDTASGSSFALLGSGSNSLTG